MKINYGDEIKNMKYSPIGQIRIELQGTYDTDISEQPRYIYLKVSSKPFRDFFSLGIDSSYSFNPLDNPDPKRDKQFIVLMGQRKMWNHLIECMDSELNYDYKTIYFLLQYLYSHKLKCISKDELVNHLHEMGCKKSDISPEAIYEELKK
ncbi:MAG: hypothetical protein K0B07_02485 [DPANN group archaeon]|nr:hypothetical protein [DPANN group archaeon]